MQIRKIFLDHIKGQLVPPVVSNSGQLGRLQAAFAGYSLSHLSLASNMQAVNMKALFIKLSWVIDLSFHGFV